MSATKEDHKAQYVSKHLTKRTFLSTKLEWRLEHYIKTVPYYTVGQSISSKTFILPHRPAVWQLDAYPQGKESQTFAAFYLRLIGFQAPDGSLSADKTKSIKADYKLFLLSSTNNKWMLNQGLTEFKTDTMAGCNWIQFEQINKFIHPDGSLLVICEIECLASDETFSMEPTQDHGSLYPILQLTDHIQKMWKSKLFTDCTLEVGAKHFPAHKCILGQWSEVFCKMFSLPMEEAESGIVEISDCSPDAMSAMLEYMYTGLVKDEIMDNMASELLALSDKYAVISLKEMCEVYLVSKLTANNVLTTATLAYRYLAAKLLKACVDYFAMHGLEVLQPQEWEHFKGKNKDLADGLLELLIKDHPCFAHIHIENTMDAE